MEAKTQPVSVRLSRDVDRFVSVEARRSKRSKGWILQSLLEEAMRMRLFPGIAFRGHDSDRRVWVIGTAFDVWEIVSACQDFGSIEALLAASDVPERRARLAMGYYERFPHEIDDAIDRNRLSFDELKDELPTAIAVRI